jgi:hypothetical protein
MRSTYRLGQTAAGPSPVFMTTVVVFSGLILGGIALNFLTPTSARRR